MQRTHEENSVEYQGTVHQPDEFVPCRIFLVEDDADDMALGKRSLETSDRVKEVVCFSNGRELIDYMKSQGFQDHSVMCLTPVLIIIDLNMPRMNGFEILKELKSDPFLQEIPVIVLSGADRETALKKARDLKANACFHKPMNVEKLHRFFDTAWQWPTNEMWLH